ncbi:MAG: DUF1003 domain-containing protein [Arenimonas sp.]|nr:DUF1003 domain-containing protein [Arenimonas sp.]
MVKPDDEAARRLFGASLDALDETARKVARHIAGRKHIARDTSLDERDGSSFGDRAADAVASFGGSWPFIFLFFAVLAAWIGINAVLLAKSGSTFDPYPYILLNLCLSMLAAIQAPIILMSQNRQAEKDRRNALHDYEVNLKAEIEIMLLHEKMDLMRGQQWNDLVALQNRQLELLERLAPRP